MARYHDPDPETMAQNAQVYVHCCFVNYFWKHLPPMITGTRFCRLVPCGISRSGFRWLVWRVGLKRSRDMGLVITIGDGFFHSRFVVAKARKQPLIVFLAP